MQEHNLLQMIIKQQSWENLIRNIVSIEGIDPWNVDLIKLTDSFLKYIENLRILDFRIPAKVVLVAAILLKMKSEILCPSVKAQQTEYSFEDLELMGEYDRIREQLSRLSLQPGIRRKVKRKVTLDELVNALKKAMRVEERRERRKRKLGRRLRREIDLGEEDIEKRINDLMLEIDGLLTKLKAEKVEFSKLVKKWERDSIVRHFLPLLHLSTRGKVATEQEKFFDEIFISKRAG